jgi:hypothetical protein
MSVNLQAGDHRKDCCKPENGNLFLFEERKDLTIMKCNVCGCRHFEAIADPGYINLKGASL